MAVGSPIEFAFDKDPRRSITREQSVNAAGDVTDGTLRVKDRLAVQITGAATECTVQMERSTRNPVSQTANWAPVGAQITGNPSTGIPVEGYIEPGAAFWRARVVTCTGTALISLSTGG